MEFDTQNVAPMIEETWAFFVKQLVRIRFFTRLTVGSVSSSCEQNSVHGPLFQRTAFAVEVEEINGS